MRSDARKRMVEHTAEKDAPTFTDRQAEAWQEVVAPILERHGIAGLPNWNLHWFEEVRLGRGHYLNATYVDGEHFAQVLMDVYGYPSVSVAELDWVHADQDEELVCETCVTSPEAGGSDA